MSLKILCCGHLVRYPLGGHCWHHLQYLIGLKRLGHDVVFMEHFGWENSCYDPDSDQMVADPAYGVRFMEPLFAQHGLNEKWCYLAEDGRAHGMSHEALRDFCTECDLCINLSNINWTDEIAMCRRRVLVDTDPVFTQIGAVGMSESFSHYDALFTYGHNVHKPGCPMPTAGMRWIGTRQPVVLDLWPVEQGNPDAPFTTVANWSAYGAHTHEGQVYGQKDREFEQFIDLPTRSGCRLSLALSAEPGIRRRLEAEGWSVLNSLDVTRSSSDYQQFIRQSKGEWCVAKHGYVVSRCGWFSDRSAGYLASARPVVLQDTCFTQWLPCGKGVIPFSTPDQAAAALRTVNEDYPAHCRAARELAKEYFDSSIVLTHLLENSL